jgi:hypothetical protein
MNDLVAMQGAAELETAGAISYWSLEGEVCLATLRDSLAIEGLEERLLPTGPTLADSLARGARESCADSRQLIRPLARGAWAFVQESVVDGDTVTHEQLLVGRVKSVEAPDGSKEQVIDIQLARGMEMTDELEVLIERIKSATERQKGILSANDMSWWLVYVAKQLHAVSLRDRGGVYFVPRDVLPVWRKITRTLSEETAHKIFEIPAVKTDEAVEAILTAVRSFVAGKFKEAEEYLAGGVSTRGLNALERSLDETHDYVDHYVGLLGTALPDLIDKLENVKGAMVAARIAHKESEATA